MTKVFIIESTSGWGATIEDKVEFDSYEEALEYVIAFNNEHCPIKDITPDWYMYAKLETDVPYFIRRSK